jgi:hypothetical protein
MMRLTIVCAGLCAMALVVAADPARATGSNQVSYVSNTGSDSNGCTNPTTDACASFQGALTNTANCGEIDCVNTGAYSKGTVIAIAQSVTIDCAGGVGSTLHDFEINGSGIVVRLRNLTINRGGMGEWGVYAENMAALYVENCVISNIPDFNGIEFDPTTNAQLFVTNSIISNNGYNGGGGINGGIYIKPASGVAATVSIDHSQIKGNLFGIVADGTSGGIVKGTISNSVVSGNTADGIAATSSGSSVWLLVDQTQVSGNTYGLAAGGSGAEILARNTSVFNNTTGLHTANGGTLYSFDNNSLNGNTTNGAFTGTVALH